MTSNPQAPDAVGPEPFMSADEWREAYFALAAVAQGQLDECRAALAAQLPAQSCDPREHGGRHAPWCVAALAPQPQDDGEPTEP